MNRVIKEKYPGMAVLAAVNPSHGVEKPAVIEVTTSFSDVLSAFVHGRVVATQQETLNEIIRADNPAPYALDLGYRAILWGPVEELTWGGRVKERFIDEKLELARRGKVGLYRLADKVIQDFLASRDTSLTARVTLAKSLAAKGWGYEAEQHYALLLRSAPQDGELHYLHGMALVQHLKLDEGLFHLRKAVTADPLQAEWHYQLGLAASAGGLSDEAGQELMEAVRLNPHLETARSALRKLTGDDR